MPDVGRMAPTFRAPVQGGEEISLKELLGKKVVLYFYPKDSTSGCTRQACDLRDEHAAWKRKGVVVIGVSPDSVASHEKFTAKHDLPFLLVSDPTHEIAEAYGVWVEKSLYGRRYMGVERSTFVIDEKGRIAHALRKVKVAGHVEQLRKLL